MKLNNKLNKANKYKLDQEKLRDKALSEGVNLVAPETIFLSKDTKFGINVTVEPYVVIGTKVNIGSNSIINSFSHIENTLMENNVVVGPYARLRPGTILKTGAKIGNFVEIKKSKIGKNSKVNHLSYIGDTSVGQNSNIGAGTITCNYDGANKNKTIISENVFIGSNSSLVAPLKIGKNTVVGAGSVITRNVKNNSLAITRPPQIEVKKSIIGKKSKVNHLSYIGDSELGNDVNIGAGTITCNYDGVNKYKTNISDNVFIGSNTSLVAPVKIDKNSTIGAGSVITRNVKKNSLALTRSKQQEIENYKRKK